jgi:hypothetical protein
MALKPQYTGNGTLAGRIPRRGKPTTSQLGTNGNSLKQPLGLLQVPGRAS